jgi:hypothetical protein
MTVLPLLRGSQIIFALGFDLWGDSLHAKPTSHQFMTTAKGETSALI